MTFFYTYVYYNAQSGVFLFVVKKKIEFSIIKICRIKISIYICTFFFSKNDIQEKINNQ